MTSSIHPTRLRDRHALLAIAMIGPLCEAVPLRYFHISAGLAPQLTAPTPFAAFHDVRWLLVFHASWLGFALELVLLLLVRSLFHTAAVCAAWPDDQPRPSLRAIWRTSVWYTATFVLVCSPSSILIFAGGATSLSWLPLAGTALLVIVALLWSHGGVVPRWWSRLPDLRVCAWIIATFIELNLVAAAILLGPWWIAWLFAALGGLFNAWAWCGLVGAILARPVPQRSLPLIPIIAAALFAIVLVTSAFELRPYRDPVDAAPLAGPSKRDRGKIALLFVDGFDSRSGASSLHIARADQFAVFQFSYAGIDRRGEPLPYVPSDTHQSIAASEAKLDVQTRALAVATGRPVRMIATSEGSVVARSYVQTHVNAPVAELIMVSPLVEPGRVYYPRAGQDGWGIAARAELSVVAHALGALAHTDLNPEMPFVRSLVDHAPALRRGMLCPAPRVPVIAIEPVAGDASIPPAGYPQLIPVKVVVGFHGTGLHAALTFATARHVPAQQRGAGVLNNLIRSGATAWMAPELPDALNPAWSQSHLDRRGCPTDGWP